MKNNEQHKVVLDVYTGLQVCTPNLKDLPAPLNDFGLSGKAITYSMTILGAYSSEVLGQYMQKQGISDKTNAFYKYKLMGNFGMLSYLYKKAENKSNERAIGEVIFETGVGIGVDSIIKHRHTIQQGAKKIAAKTTTKLGISLGSRILAGATTGAVVGSSAPIVGTIVGAVAGAFLAGIAEDFFFGEGWFEDKDKKRELQQQERENRLYKIYITKINQIGDYLLRHKYIEKRILKDYESDELCRSINNPNESYFKTILLMLSFHNYLDKDTEFYKSLQSQDTQKDSKEIESNNKELCEYARKDQFDENKWQEVPPSVNPPFSIGFCAFGANNRDVVFYYYCTEKREIMKTIEDFIGGYPFVFKRKIDIDNDGVLDNVILSVGNYFGALAIYKNGKLDAKASDKLYGDDLHFHGEKTSYQVVMFNEVPHIAFTTYALPSNKISGIPEQAEFNSEIPILSYLVYDVMEFEGKNYITLWNKRFIHDENSTYPETRIYLLEGNKKELKCTYTKGNN